MLPWRSVATFVKLLMRWLCELFRSEISHFWSLLLRTMRIDDICFGATDCSTWCPKNICCSKLAIENSVNVVSFFKPIWVALGQTLVYHLFWVWMKNWCEMQVWYFESNQCSRNITKRSQIKNDTCKDDRLASFVMGQPLCADDSGVKVHYKVFFLIETHIVNNSKFCQSLRNLSLEHWGIW